MRKFVSKVIFLVAALSISLIVTWPFQDQPLIRENNDELFMKQMQYRMDRRRKHVKKICKEQGMVDDKLFIREHMMYSRRYKVLFCQIPKTGMTNWMELFAKLDGISSNRRTGTELKRFFKRKLQLNNPNDIQRKLGTKQVKKLLVVREPLERLLSAFRDKLDNKPISFYKPFSKRLRSFQGNSTSTGALNGELSLKCVAQAHTQKVEPALHDLAVSLFSKAGVYPTELSERTRVALEMKIDSLLSFLGEQFASFDEFISYLVSTPALRNGDLHWKMYRPLCQPCAVDYDVIAHQETMLEDSRYFLHLIGAPKKLFLKGMYKHPTDDTVLDKYYTNLQPRENLDKLVYLLQDDYLLFNYTRPI